MLPWAGRSFVINRKPSRYGTFDPSLSVPASVGCPSNGTAVMIDGNLYQVEVAGRAATMYIVGRVTAAARQSLQRACDVLPASVHLLSVSVSNLDQLGDGAPMVLQELRRYWSWTRRGAFRLTFGHDGRRHITGEILIAG